MRIKLKVLSMAASLGLLLAATAATPLTPAGEGRRVYLRENCYGCHGGRGGGGMGSNFRREKPESGDLAEAVRDGEDRGMPGYPNLSSTDIQNLAAYFQSLGTSSEPTFTHWWETTPSR